jgi:uncharacterized peroxidase-related enzyme
VQAKLGLTPNMTRTMAASPSVLQAYLAFSGALAGGSLPAGLREQIALAVGEANRCQYCVSAHVATGRKVGIPEDVIASSRGSASRDPKADAALKFAQAIVVRRGDVTDEDVERVRQAGYTEGEIAEIIAAVSLNVFTNYFNLVAGTEIDFPGVPLNGAATR